MSVRSFSRRTLVAVAVGRLLTADAAAQEPVTFPREKVLPVTMAVLRSAVATPPLVGTGLIWRGRVAHSVAVPAIRLHVVVSGRGSGWRLIVRSEATGEISDTYESTSPFVAAGAFWTREVPGSAAIIDLLATADCSQLALAIDRYAFETAAFTQQAIHGIDGRLAMASASARVQALGRPVVRLRIMIDALGQAACTGFLVTDSLLFTNEHCVATLQEAQSTLVDFGYEFADSPFETLRVNDLVAVSHSLDYALLHLETPAAARWGRLKPNGALEMTEGQQLILPEHPLGGYKQVSLESCEISGVQMSGVTADRTDFGHKCDTLNGSSGSPVLDHESGTVVGLHHFGFNAATNTFVNRAVRIALILKDVKAQRPSLPDF